jgi:hypothetical protein
VTRSRVFTKGQSRLQDFIFPSTEINILRPCVVVHVCNPSIWETEAGASRVRGQPGLQRETLSKAKHYAEIFLKNKTLPSSKESPSRMSRWDLLKSRSNWQDPESGQEASPILTFQEYWV